jgi:hypothetical protein
MPAIPAGEAISFLKDTRGALTWTVREMVDSLKITEPEAKQVIAILELQGYVKPALDGAVWLTTIYGEEVSGSQSPRFNLARVTGALAELKDRIQAQNRDRRAEFHVSDAVAFGDFLMARPRVQAADVGVRLVVLKDGTTQGELGFLKQLRAKSALIRLQSFEPWMSLRSHRRLV